MSSERQAFNDGFDKGAGTALDALAILKKEFDNLVRYVRVYRNHKKGTNWNEAQEAYQALSDETRKAIEQND